MLASASGHGCMDNEIKTSPRHELTVNRSSVRADSEVNISLVVTRGKTQSIQGGKNWVGGALYHHSGPNSK